MTIDQGKRPKGTDEMPHYDDMDIFEHDRLLLQTENAPPNLPLSRCRVEDSTTLPIKFATWKQCLFVLAVAASTFAAGVLSADLFMTSLSLSATKSTSAGDLEPLKQKDSLVDAFSPFNFSQYLRSSPPKQSPDGEHKVHRRYKYPSPYEERFPKYELPYWAKKNLPYNDAIPPEHQICFVHVGKAGGSSVGCSLGFSLHCSTNDQTIYGLLSMLTTHVFHRGVYDCRDNAAYYLFVIRDPLARALSAFNYDRPDSDAHQRLRKDKFYLECPFWTLEEMAQKGLVRSGDEAASDHCQWRAHEALRGTYEYIAHWYFNYQYYFEFLPKNINILVIRNEHIVDDWNGIEVLLGGRDDSLKPTSLPQNNAHEKNSTDLYLSEESKLALCQALCNEIQVYKSILRNAKNLKEDDIQQSLKELKGSCPREALEENCLEKKPDIRDKIEDRRGW